MKSILRHSFHIAGKQIFYLAVILTALVLMLVGSATWLTHAVTERKDDIAKWAGNKMGYTLEIGEVGLYWLDLLPKLYLSDIRLLTAENVAPFVEANQVFVGLNLWKSLQKQQAVIDSAMISGLIIGVNRDAAGAFHLAGLSETDDAYQLSEDALAEAVELLQKVTLNAIQITYQDVVKPHFNGVYHIDTAALQQYAMHWQMDAHVQLPNHLGEQVSFRAEVKAPELRIADWKVTLAAQQLQLGTWLQGADYDGVEITRGRADVQLTAKKQAVDTAVDGRLLLTQTEFAATDANQPINTVLIHQLDTTFDWQQQNDQWQLQLNHALLDMEGERWPEGEIRLAGQGHNVAQLSADFLRLSDLTALGTLVANPNPYLQQHQPAGELTDVNIAFNAQQELVTLQLQVKEIAFLGHENLPGASGLSFSVDWQQSALALEIDSTAWTLFADGWLEEEVDFDSLNGQIHWQRNDSGWHLATTALSVVNEDMNLQLDGTLTEQQGLQADMQLAIAYLAVPRWDAYVPTKVLDETFARWVENAFLAGEIRHGHIHLTGDPTAYPFDLQPEAGTFELFLDVADLTLNYNADWPPLTEVAGQVTSTGNNLSIIAEQGQVSGYKFDKVTAEIEPFVSGRPQLEVNGRILGEPQNGLDFLANSPLRSRIGGLTDVLSAKGSSLIELTLNVPLLDPDATQLQGEVTLMDSELFLSLLPTLPIQQVNGQLQFTNQGVTADGISAKVLYEDAKVTIAPHQDKMRVAVDARITATALPELWQGAQIEEISGATAVLTTIDIMPRDTGDFGIEVTAVTDLTGMQFNLPAPLQKTTVTPWPLTLTFLPNASPSVSVELDSFLFLQWDNSESSPQMNLHLGGQPGRLPAQGFSVSGNLETLNLDPWLDWIAKHDYALANTDLTTAFMPDLIDVSLETVIVNQQIFNSVAIVAQQQPVSWQIQLASEEMKGRIYLPFDEDTPANLDFDFVYITLSDTQSDPENSAVERALWPGFQLTIDDLTIDEMKLGRFEATAIQQPNHWHLTSATLQSPVLKASASAQWRRLSGGDQSTVNLSVESGDLAGLLIDLGYLPAMEANRAQVEADLRWPGEPFAFSRQSLQGDMQIDIGSGQMKEVDPGAAGRIFGLLSFAAIPRRLALDFSDLFGGGFGFSSIKGRFAFADGIARTQDLTLRGDSALIEVSGPINLVEESYNQVVKVTPSVSSTLPLAGAVAGGPIGLGVGTAIFLADRIAGKLFNREIVNLISYRYRLTGPWRAPEMTLTRSSEQ